MNTGEKRCRNCHASLQGEYCAQCGQREGHPDLRFSDAAGEIVGDVFSWDSRLWRTLQCLLFRPGFLPAEFMAGRKARYVPPLRLYLVISFLLFLVLSLGSEIMVLGGPPDSPEVTGQQMAPTARPGRAELGRAEPGVSEDTEADISFQLGGRTEESSDSASATIEVDIADEDSPLWLQELDKRVEDNADKLREDPSALIDVMVEYLPQMMFLLLPVFALLLKSCYLFCPFHYLQHLVFALYYHSFAYLIYLLGVLVERFNVHFDGLLISLVFIYLPVALWRVYGSGIAGALGKSLVIFLVYGFSLMLGFSAVSLIALALM